MSTPRTLFRLATALAVLLFGMPLGGLEAPVTPGGEAGDAVGPIWFSNGLEAPAAPETGASRQAPEYSMVASPGGVATVAGLGSAHVATRGSAALGASTPLYLSHCAFLC